MISYNYSWFEPVKNIALTFPGTKEAVSYGTPSVKVNGKFMCRINGDFIPIRLDFTQLLTFPLASVLVSPVAKAK
jgi:hypothetical protein